VYILIIISSENPDPVPKLPPVSPQSVVRVQLISPASLGYRRRFGYQNACIEKIYP
jgi:hypothetical protein